MYKLKNYSKFFRDPAAASSSTARMRRLRRLKAESRSTDENERLATHENHFCPPLYPTNNVSLHASDTVVSVNPNTGGDYRRMAQADENADYESSVAEIAPHEETVFDSQQPAVTSVDHGLEDDPCAESESHQNEKSEGRSSEPFHEFLTFEHTQPLCSHTECTPNDILVMCLTFSFRHNLSWKGMEDLLKMINAIYGEKKINVSKTSFMRQLFVNKGNQDLKFHYYCDSCSKYLDQTNSSLSKIICKSCEEILGESSNANFFVSLPFKSQLKKLLSNDNLADMMMNYRFARSKEREENLEDIYDGSQYKALSQPGQILSVKENFSYCFFVDGVAVSKGGSCKKSLWPIYVSINELPPKERRQHILLVGLYYGSHDPDQSIFLKPFVDEANVLSTEGFSWMHRGRYISSKVVPLLCVADSVARCRIINFQAFNAYFGCTFCYQKQSLTSKKLKFVIPDKKAEDRTLESYRYDLSCAFEKRHEVQMSKRQHRGVKGPSALTSLLNFDIMKGLVVDSMHNIFLGVCKTYFELIFECSRRKFWCMLEEETYAIEDVKSQIDHNLLQIRPPTAISRTPRSIKDCNNWKANEWRVWILIYCIPCLQGILRQKYLVHLAMLCKASCLLLQSSVTHSDVDEAHKLLLKFIFYYQKYFGPEHMYYNIHLLSHICKGVLRYGPLHTHNAFMFESYNRNLLQLCKNPYRVVKEVSHKYLILRDLPLLSSKILLSQNSVFYCKKVLDLGLVRCKRADSCVLVGAGKSCQLDEYEKQYLINNGLCPWDCLFYSRMILNGSRITTSHYSIDKKNNDSIVVSSGLIYEVIAICVSSVNCVHVLAKRIGLSDDLIICDDDVTIDSVRGIVDAFRSLTLLKTDCLDGQCMYVKTSNGHYVAQLNFAFYDD